MSVNFILGNIGAGKTSECIIRIEEIKKEKSDARVIMIVPDRYSYAAEKLITQRFSGTGLNGIDVMTFSRLCDRLIPKCEENYLSKSGKAILITKAVSQIQNEDNVYSGCINKSGFADSVLKLITEMKRYMLTPEILRYTADKMKQSMTKNKLLSLAEIYEKYEELIRGSFIDSEEDLTRLSKSIESSTYFDDAYVFIDEFSDFLPQHYPVILSVTQKSADMYITLPFDLCNPTDKMSQIPEKTYLRLKTLFEKNGIALSEKHLENTKKGFASDEIKFFFDNYDSFNKSGFVPYDKQTEDISLFIGRDPFSETEYCAKRIASDISQKNIRYSDIMLICGDKELYSGLIQSIFSDYNIPYFTDLKMIVTEHPIILTVLGIFDIISNKWNYDSVIGYIKSGYVYVKEENKIKPFDPDDADFLASYVLKKGIKGKKKWLCEEAWSITGASVVDAYDGKEQSVDLEKEKKLNSIRRLLTAPIEEFIQNISGRKTVREYAEALFAFLKSIYMPEGLKIQGRILNEKGMRNEAEQLSLIWNLLLEVIDQTVVTLGASYCSTEEFRSYLYAGLSECSIDIIPSSVDCVTVTGADTSVQKNVSSIYVLGALRGAVPAETTNEGIITNREREEITELIQEQGLEIGQNTHELNNASEYRFYKVLFSAEDSITVSYPINNFEGELQSPSQLVSDLVKIFPDISQKNDLISDVQGDGILYSPKAAFEYLLNNRSNCDDTNRIELYNWFLQREEWKDKLGIIDTADNYKKNDARITQKNAGSIYDFSRGYSVSRLNEYSQCPFRYFAKNGLKARKEETLQIQKLDLGSLMHIAIYRYCLKIEEGISTFEQLKQRWNSLTEEESDGIINDIISDMKNKIMPVLDNEEGKTAYLIARMEKTLKRSIKTVKTSIASGTYAPCNYECDFAFSVGEDNDVNINGKIDRVDISFDDKNNRAELRVIDYKTGKKDFSEADIYNMLDIQLVIYAFAAVKLYESGKLKYRKNGFSGVVTAVLYNQLRDEIERDDGAIIGNPEESSIKNDKLGGRFIVDCDEEGNPDFNSVFRLDEELSNSRKSSYFNFKITTKNAIDKYSKFLNREDFDLLVRHAVKSIVDYDKRIKKGDIKIQPYLKGDNSACMYCEMAEICLFDAERDKTRELCIQDDEALEKLKIEYRENV